MLAQDLKDPAEAVGHLDACLQDQEPEVFLLSSVCALAKGLQLTSVAEGVESEDQYLQLASLGCDRLQGYWIAKPLASESLVSWVKSRGAAR